MTRRRQENESTREERMQEILTTLERGIESILTSEGYRKYLDTASRFHGYSFGNVILVMLQNPEATRVAGFHTWKQMGRFVKKGEKGIKIMVPYKAKIEQEDTDPLYIIRGFGVGYVWDTLSRDSDGHTAAHHESVRECRAVSHAAMVG